jgi:hypothetical protein
VASVILALAAKQSAKAAPRIRKAPISLTDSAVRRVKDLLSKRNQVSETMQKNIAIDLSQAAYLIFILAE